MAKYFARITFIDRLFSQTPYQLLMSTNFTICNSSNFFASTHGVTPTTCYTTALDRFDQTTTGWWKQFKYDMHQKG
jgi:hypothetical protein